MTLPDSGPPVGALAFSGCADVKVLDCVLTCPDGTTTVQACLSVDPASEPGAVTVERTRCAAGSNQLGIYVSGASVTTVAQNHVLLAPVPHDAELFFASADVQSELHADLTAAVQRQPAPTGETFAVGVGDVQFNIDQASPAAALWREFAQSPEAVALGTSVSTANLASDPELAARLMEKPIADFVGRISGTPPPRTGLTDALRPALAAMRAVGRGIVVLASATTHLMDNVVDDALAGLVVVPFRAPTVAWRRPRGGFDGFKDIPSGGVIASRNTLRCLAPWSSGLNCCAVYIQGSLDTQVEGSVATLRRPTDSPLQSEGGALVRGVSEPDGVRAVVVHWQRGSFMVIRQTSTQGFVYGVAADAGLPRPTVFVVTETLAEGTGSQGGAVLTSDNVFQQNNFATP